MPTSKEELLRRGLKPHDIQHNQHRRAEWQDYGGCGLYMITLCIDGRHPFFGYLEGNIKATRGTTDFPHIVLSTLGRTILENELPKIHRLYPQIEIWQAAIMPDHLHLLLYIREPLPQGKHLGHIISSFKGGCSRAWWAQTATGKTDANATGTAATDTKAVVPAASAAVKTTGPALFESGYHDRIIRRPGMLDTIKRYMNDNPLRALMRRQLPYLMERRLHLRIGTREYAAFGACACGALLILAPWGLDEEIMKTDANSTEAPSDYARFHRLNDLAEEICNTTDVTLLNMTGIA